MWRSSMTDYDQFIADKLRERMPHGFDPKPITAPLFDWQKYVVGLALKAGRYALFEDCGLGKTLQQLEWARQVVDHTGRPVIILTPLAVAAQTQAEASRFGYKTKIAREQNDVPAHGIAITNYEKLDHFDPSAFAGVVLDESSILKNLTGKTRKALTEAFCRTPYRLCCTATPSPNDYTEFGQHADFLGLCTPAQMLCTYFINDTFNTGDWRLKRHAESAFWRWVASWAACVSKPSDIGFSDDGYILPPLRMRTETVEVDIVEERPDDELFRVATLSATTMHKEMRLTAPARAAKVAELVNDSDEPWIVWCNTNTEADELTDLIPDGIEVRGDDSPESKEKGLSDFTMGKARVIITKPSIAGMGLNWQHCHNVAFVGLSYSFEDFYQALRRSYRFGQTKPVNAYIVQAATEGAILQAVQAKIEAHAKMQEQMKLAANYLRKA